MRFVEFKDHSGNPVFINPEKVDFVKTYYDISNGNSVGIRCSGGDTTPVFGTTIEEAVQRLEEANPSAATVSSVYDTLVGTTWSQKDL